jgi:hypothetical protein
MPVMNVARQPNSPVSSYFPSLSRRKIYYLCRVCKFFRTMKSVEVSNNYRNQNHITPKTAFRSICSSRTLLILKLKGPYCITPSSLNLAISFLL